jgi:RNA recognition motif-containing protein
LRTDVPVAEQGRSRGYGIVLFEKQREAMKAIEVMD